MYRENAWWGKRALLENVFSSAPRPPGARTYEMTRLGVSLDATRTGKEHGDERSLAEKRTLEKSRRPSTTEQSRHKDIAEILSSVHRSRSFVRRRSEKKNVTPSDHWYCHYRSVRSPDAITRFRHSRAICRRGRPSSDRSSRATSNGGTTRAGGGGAGSRPRDYRDDDLRRPRPRRRRRRAGRLRDRGRGNNVNYTH